MQLPPLLNKFEFPRWRTTSKYFPSAIITTCCGFTKKYCIRFTKVIAKMTLELSPGGLRRISEVQSIFEKWRLSCNETSRSRFTELWNNLKLQVTSGNCKSIGYIKGWVLKVRKGSDYEGICLLEEFT